MKLMKYLVVLILLFRGATYAQVSDETLQNKYFNLRDHFHKSYIFVGSSYYNIDPKTSIVAPYYKGCSLPFDIVPASHCGVDIPNKPSGCYVTDYSQIDGVNALINTVGVAAPPWIKTRSLDCTSRSASRAGI